MPRFISNLLFRFVLLFFFSFLFFFGATAAVKKATDSVKKSNRSTVHNGQFLIIMQISFTFEKKKLLGQNKKKETVRPYDALPALVYRVLPSFFFKYYFVPTRNGEHVQSNPIDIID